MTTLFAITGNTFPVKDTLRSMGCRWNPARKCWTTTDPQVHEQAMALVCGRSTSTTSRPSSAPRPRRAPAPPKDDIRIEFPSRGRTYCTQEYGVYKYSIYKRSSVLAGQECRQFLGSYATLEAAQAAHPEADVTCCGYTPIYLNHLPGPDDADPYGDDRDAYLEMEAEARCS